MDPPIPDTAASPSSGPGREELVELASLFYANRHVEAEAAARRMIETWPEYGIAWKALGAVLAAQARLAEAVPALQKAVGLLPVDAETHNTLGNVLQRLGRFCESEASYRRAIELRPGYFEAYNNLGAELQTLGRVSEAEASYRRAVELKPDYHEAHNNLGNALQVLGRAAEAEASCRRALELKPDYHEAHDNLGTALQALGRLSEAEAGYRRALELEPGFHIAHNNLGNVLQALGRSSEAEASFCRAIELKPDFHVAYNNLGTTLQALGRMEEAESAYRRALGLKPDYHRAHSNLLLELNYGSGRSRAQVFEEHLAWARQHEAPLEALRRPHANPRDPNRRLRLGYVSPDFRRHSVAYFVEPVLASHDRDAFEVYCYSNVARPDGVTQRLTGLADCVRNILGMSDERAAELVRADGIDVLVDLAGHTANGRPGLFARKPAPVQAGYLGYPNTSGLGAIGWRLTDIHADPPGDGDAFHTERLVRLPETFLCYRPPEEEAPGVRPPPSLDTGRITFGSFNALQKVTPEVIRTWAKLLDRVSGSRLMLKALGLSDPAGRERLLGEFARHGIGPERVSLHSRDADFRAHLARYHEVDVGLDPFPYNGTTTTFEALWMGVPVVSIAGDRHAARVGASILANLGLEALIASDVDAYLALAAGLAADVARRAVMGAEMRERMRASPLLDGARLTRHIEAAYREMWKLWCLAGSNALPA